MKEKNDLVLFETNEIRRVWYNEEWYYSIVDVVGVLSGSLRPRKYWADLKQKIILEGFIEVSEKIGQLKIIANDGKSRETDCCNTETLLRIIQSIPSQKAEPFKRWLAEVGYERIKEIEDPELAMHRMKSLYEKKGYSKSWIEQRERGIITRHLLTDEWKDRGAKNEIEYGILTNEIYKHGFGLTAKDYKEHKNIDQQRNLRDSMTNIELALTNLGEASAVELHRKRDTTGLTKLKDDTKEAGDVLHDARESLEDKLGESVVSTSNYLNLTNKKEIEN